MAHSCKPEADHVEVTARAGASSRLAGRPDGEDAQRPPVWAGARSPDRVWVPPRQGAGLNLEQGTHDDSAKGPLLDERGWPVRPVGAVYGAKTFMFPDGGVETVAWWLGRFDMMGDPRMAPLRVRSPEEVARLVEENRDKCRARARAQIRRLSRSWGLDRLLTFTTREQSNTRDSLLAAWMVMRRKIKSHFGADFPYIAVAEPHPSNPGHWHLHVAIKGWRSIIVLRKMWHESLWTRGLGADGLSPGNVQIPKDSMRYQGALGSRRLSVYLAKYLAKSFDDIALRGRKRYWQSESGEGVRVVKWFPAALTDAELERELWADPCVKNVEGVWVFRGSICWMEGAINDSS